MITIIYLAIQFTSLFGPSINAVFYADNGKSQTVEYEFEEYERWKFQTEVLHLLGLENVPKKVTIKEQTVPSYMLDLYRSFQDGEHDQSPLLLNNKFSFLDMYNYRDADKVANLFDPNEADTIMSFVDQSSILSDKNRFSYSDTPKMHIDNKLKHLTFDLDDIKDHQFSLIGAELRVFRNSTDRSNNSMLNVYAPRVSPENGEYQLHLVAASKLGHLSWTVLNATTPFDYWRKYPDQNHGLLLEILDDKGERQPSDVAGVASAFIVVFLKTEQNQPHVRRKRSASYPEQGYSINEQYSGRSITEFWTREACRHKTFHVKFKDIGWDEWIIAPSEYNAGYCDGECSFPLTSTLNATNHAIVQTLVHIMNPDMAPKPCCAPTSLSKLRLLFFDDNYNVLMKNYDQMTVKSCGCH